MTSRMKWPPRHLFHDLFVLSPAMEALGELSVFFVLHGQQQFTRSVRLFVSQMLDINLDGIKENKNFRRWKTKEKARQGH